jgi:ankyrin repeat protein
VTKTPLADSAESPELRIDQIDEAHVALYANNREVQRLNAPGRVGLTVDGCHVRFRVAGVGPGAHLSLTELIDPDQRDAEQRTPLHRAILDEDTGKAERLLLAGADVERALENGVTPIMMAAFKDNPKVARLLLESGANVHRPTGLGTTALHYAAVRGDPELVQLLLDAGAKVDASKPGGTTPLILAAQNGRAGAIVALVEAGADVNARLAGRNITGLMLAAQNGHAAAVRALLEKGADWRCKDWQGRTALDYATANDRTAAVDALQKAIRPTN